MGIPCGDGNLLQGAPLTIPHEVKHLLELTSQAGIVTFRLVVGSVESGDVGVVGCR